VKRPTSPDIERRDLRKSRSVSPPAVNKRAALKIKQMLAQRQPLEFANLHELRDFMATVERDTLNLKYDFDNHYTSYIARQNFSSGEYRGNPAKDRSSENLPTAQGLLNMSSLEEPLRVDYINASVIDDSPQLYVATQHPLENSILDFWKMILAVKPSVILMLDGLEYLTKGKYPKYWPEEGEILTMQNTAGTIVSVHAVDCSQQQYSFGVLRMLSVRLQLPNNEILQEWNVWHIRCDCWQDQGQIELKQFTDLWRIVQEKEAGNSKLVVHCIGGIGRTGTFITVDMAVRQMNQSHISIDNIILKLRRHRMNIVAHPLHYLFCYKAALKLVTDL